MRLRDATSLPKWSRRASSEDRKRRDDRTKDDDSFFITRYEKAINDYVARFVPIQRLNVIYFICLLVGLFYLAFSLPDTNPSFTAPPLPNDFWITRDLLADLPNVTYSEDHGGPRWLHFFVPADAPHLNLCKTVMSAIALGYPAPTILNWQGQFNHPEWHLAGSHIAKLESLLAVLDRLLNGNGDEPPEATEHDLILLVNGYDVWFQLPPFVLIERYHQLNREADERLLREWQAAGAMTGDFPVRPPKQKIVVTPGKHCSPGPESGSDPHYDHWPASPMREDLYGEDTDKIVPLSSDPARKYKNLRPRCLNSGFIMGTAGALRDAMQRAKQKIDSVARQGRQIWSDQALLGEVIGEQELWRTFMRDLGASWDGDAASIPMAVEEDVRRIGEAALQGQRFEFGIGLDYNFTTIPPTCSAEEEGYFVHLNDASAVEANSEKAGVPGPVRVHGIPPEISNTKFIATDPLRNVSWGDAPLYTDFFFGNTPVGIHHNAYVDGLKSIRRDTWWSKMWFYPYLRDLIAVNFKPGHEGWWLARFMDQEYFLAENRHGTVYRRAVESWNGVTHWDGKRPYGEQFVRLSWDDICQAGPTPWTDELFGDGKGPLVT